MVQSNKINDHAVAVVFDATGVDLRSPGKANYHNLNPVVGIGGTDGESIIIWKDIAEMYGLKIVLKNRLEYKNDSEELVSRLNNWMEKHADFFKDQFVDDVVDEMGFGYCDDNPDKLQFIMGCDLCDSKYTISQAREMIENNGKITVGIIEKLQEEE